MKKLVLSLAATVLVSFSAVAEDTAGVQFSFFDFNAPQATDINGVRFPTIYGKQGGNVQGADVQLLG